jgi:hypothetical protein
MGYGSYSYDDRTTRSRASGWDTAPREEIFTQRNINDAMSPHGVEIRESRDSEEHPNSFPIILGLDITGSMGSIPHHLVREGLPHIMDRIIQSGIPDPQVLFLGIGDHECDRAPLQVGQFESGDELLDHWLTTLWIEGGGGGNPGESYHLAWMFAARHTAIDHMEQRNHRGVLITIGDEPCLPSLPAAAQQAIMGNGEYSNITAAELLDAAREMYDVYHIHMGNSARGHAVSGWTQLMGDHLIVTGRQPSEAPAAIVDTVLQVWRDQGGTSAEAPRPPVGGGRFDSLE